MTYFLALCLFDWLLLAGCFCVRNVSEKCLTVSGCVLTGLNATRRDLKATYMSSNNICSRSVSYIITQREKNKYGGWQKYDDYGVMISRNARSIIGGKILISILQNRLTSVGEIILIVSSPVDARKIRSSMA